MNYHDNLIQIILDNKEKLEWDIGMYNCSLKKEVSLSSFGDIDILVNGTCIENQEQSIAIIEVKGHKGLINHYIKKQLPKYVQRFPDAKQFVFYGTIEQDRKYEKINFLQLI